MSLIKYNFPDFIMGRQVYISYFSLRKNHPEIFFDDSEIISIFGMFPNCIWNGGGEFTSSIFFTPDMIKNCFYYYNYVLNIPLRLTCTNPTLEEKDFYDSYGNLILEIGNNGMNELITSSNNFEEYLRSKYSNYKYVKSIIGTKEQNVFLDDKYYMSCIKRSCNNNWKILDTIPADKRNKVEFLCTDPCPDNCPRIYSHYLLHGERQKKYCYSDIDSACTMNMIKGDFSYAYAKTLHSYINRENIIKNYVPKGFYNFKISGRFNIGAIINSICLYLIKPEFQIDANEYLINNIINEKDLIFPCY